MRHMNGASTKFTNPHPIHYDFVVNWQCTPACSDFIVAVVLCFIHVGGAMPIGLIAKC